MSKAKIAVLIYLCGMAILHAVWFAQAWHLVRKGYSDFTIYYGAATLVRRGLGHQLYDDVTQYKVQREFAPDVPIRQSALPFNHPPFEALLFVPFTYFSYVPAFVCWDLVNLGILAVIPFLVGRHVPELRRYPWPLWMLASLAFFPIFFALLQGQDAILLLLIYVLAFVCLKKGWEALAGGLLALGLFKPHLVLPFVLLWALGSGRRIVYGFVAMGATLVLVSLGIVGIRGFLSYPGYVSRLERTMGAGAIRPADMPNLRGVIYMLAYGSGYSTIITIVLSCGILVIVAWLFRQADKNSGGFYWRFSLAVVTTIVISYHCLGYDLSILFLPALLIIAHLERSTLRRWPRAMILTAFALLFFSPLELFLLTHGNRLGIVGWAVLLLLGGIALQTWKDASDNNASHQLAAEF